MAASRGILLAFVCAIAIQSTSAIRMKMVKSGEPKLVLVTAADHMSFKKKDTVNHMFACVSTNTRARFFDDPVFLKSSKGYWGKMPALRAYIESGLQAQSLKANDIIYFTDAFDVIFTRNVSVGEAQAFLNDHGGSHMIVFNGESDCWPGTPKLCGGMQEQRNKSGRTGDLVYLNSGQMIGEVQTLLAFIKAYDKDLKALKAHDKAFLKAGDQHVIQHLCYNNPAANDGFQCSIDSEAKMMLTSQGLVGRQGDGNNYEVLAKNLGSAVGVHFCGKDATEGAAQGWADFLAGFGDAISIKGKSIEGSCSHWHGTSNCIDVCKKDDFRQDVRHGLP